mgnify:CR=1 FL=1
MGAYHSTCRPETVGLAGDFHRPYESSKDLTLYRCSGAAVDVFVVPVGVEEAVA